MVNIFKKNLKESMSKQCFEETTIVTKEQENVQAVNEQCCEEEKFSAQKALEIASSKWTSLQTEEIIKDIKRYAENGRRSICFFERTITEQQVLLLEEMGFQACVDEWYNKTPYVKVSW